MQPNSHEPTGRPEGLTDAERAFYEKFRREFSAADLQKYTELEAGVPLEQVIAEMERVHTALTRPRGSDAHP
jgi:hypothetical protein